MMKTTGEKQTESQNELVFTEEERSRLQRIGDKRDSGTFEIAFCGHFSAGKSTLLNRLVSADILPVSPIPTSANVIKIRQGETGLNLHTKTGGDDIRFDNDIPWDKVRNWGMDGDELAGMTITAPLAFLGENGCIVDTPGVDSTDESHESVTLEQLYTTDAIVYVMDYNHVQSETNLYFLKQLTEENKPVYIVINQIDKHNEEEISLADYKQSVDGVFKSWGIRHYGIYFTTMKKMDHPANEFSRLEQHIKGLLYNSSKIAGDSYAQVKKGFYKSVMSRVQEEKQEAVDAVLQEIDDKGYKSEDLAKQETLEKELEFLRHYRTEMFEAYQEEMGSFYRNVTLFPYTTTELVRSWLESQQKGFKTGFLFSKKKTQEEQERRLAKLTEELQDKIKSQLMFHVKAYFQNTDRHLLSNKNDFEKALGELNVTITADRLKNNVNSGPVNRDYVYNFTKEMTAQIVRDVQSQAERLMSLKLDGLQAHYKKEEETVLERLFALSELEPYKEQITAIEERFKQQLKCLENELQTLPADSAFKDKAAQTAELPYPTSPDNASFITVSLPEESVIDEEFSEAEVETESFSEQDMETSVAAWKTQLLEGSRSQLFEKDRKQLLDRIERFENQTFIISLFGAFSAGKSSFANALLGAKVMPVSPHPTTAAVNTVQKPTDRYENETAVVTFKTEEALSKEVAFVAESLDLKLDLKSLAGWKPSLKEFVTSYQKTNADYLMTIRKSLEKMEHSLGETLTVSFEEMNRFVADETHACLVEKVDMYYDCPLTEKGIVLVDTPGVNSINGRHTNLAFQQLRQSDAIFYLTYYNHAFSKADHYFLQQMGQVNESFNEDKLYFIINASDLAGSRGELNGVRQHVRDQLVSNGITRPRLHHVSSKEGLANKLSSKGEESSFSEFEAHFYDKTILELKSLSFKLLSSQLIHYTGKMLDTIQFMNEEHAVQVEKQSELKQAAQKEMDRVEEAQFSHAVRDIFHELEQFTLYLRQRMTYVLNDYYPTAVNVTVLTGSSKKELQSQLAGALQEWRSLGEQFLKQELEAVAIRLENAMKRISTHWFKMEEETSRTRLPYLSVEEKVPSFRLETGSGELSFNLEVDPFLPYIKSKKDFFEEGKIKELKEAVVEAGAEQASGIIRAYESQLEKQAEEELGKLEKSLKNLLIKGIDEESKRFDILLDPGEKTVLQKEYEEVSGLIQDRH
ncbi:dynamin family protein [Salipaludibacillus sp. CUR1]|uniref:dynamin family protein n=1 Tax=Salipaludibacillus sp. CUR1 TaxID=2820003 RepID=UPI001E2AD028|nr:dynamin family protein [Salipaludibacillus sp. CUR1]MCE7791914.1 dynamin family protein [Salipaludibacillus sp. CUR1]